MVLVHNDSILSAASLIKRHEGLELKPYKCTSNKTTIGFGRNLEDVGISENEAEFLLYNDIQGCVKDLEGYKFWSHLCESRRSALIDMRYNLGPSGFRKFKNMIAALERKDFSTASSEMLNSRWAIQVKGRALRLSSIIKFGEIA